MDAPTELQMSPGTESIARASFAKGFYYNDEENMLKCVEILLPFDKNDEIKELLGKYKESVSDIHDIDNKLLLSHQGETYLSMKSKSNLQQDLRDLRKESHRIRTILTGFIVSTMEKKDILRDEFTVMKLSKLPLTLRGSRGLEETPDEEGEDFEEY